jgi:hypothetical protein
MFGLTMQREEQNKLLDELFSPISQRILPASIEERIALYEKRMQLEEQNISYKITKHKFLNYREFSLKVIKNKTEIIPSYALFYSTLPRKKATGRIEYTIDAIHFFNRDEIKFITLDFYNKALKKSYKNIYELLYNPPSYQEETHFRQQLMEEMYDLSPIIVVEEIPHNSKLIVELDTKVYEDTKEKLIVKV